MRDYGNDGGIGLEPTFDEYLSKLVAVFAEVRRVLRDDGTLWLNMGDSYFPHGGSRGNITPAPDNKHVAANAPAPHLIADNAKPKDLIGQPWRLAFALQGDGWYLRSDIIWHKSNPMPESVTDRPTKSHEYVFLMTESAKYYYNADAVRETPAQDYGTRPEDYNGKTFNWTKEKGGIRTTDKWSNPLGRNLRTVWTIPTEAFPEAHFATFPQRLVKRCLMAGTPPKCCGVCGVPWAAVVEKERSFESGSGRSGNMPVGKHGPDLQGGGATKDIRRGPCVQTQITGYRSACDHNDDTGRSIVLDPFMGSGTVALVAKELSRDYIGMELNADYIEMAQKRLTQEVLPLAG